MKNFLTGLTSMMARRSTDGRINIAIDIQIGFIRKLALYTINMSIFSREQGQRVCNLYITIQS